MKSNMYKMMVTCLCVWAVGMATENSQSEKADLELKQNAIRLIQVQPINAIELQKKVAVSPNAKKEATYKADMELQKKVSTYQNAKKEAAYKIAQLGSVEKLTLDEFNDIMEKLDPIHDGDSGTRDCDWTTCYYDDCCYYTAYNLYYYGSYNTCSDFVSWGYDCSDPNVNGCGEVTGGAYGNDYTGCCDDGLCDGQEAGDEAGPCDDAAYPSWAGDGYCDSSNNTDGCWDGGDCCESTCVDGSYSCETSGGCNGDCLDPDGSNDACAPPACADGEVDCLGDGTECVYGSWACDGMDDCSNGADEADCAPATCEDQGLWDCGDGQCIPTSYVCD